MILVKLGMSLISKSAKEAQNCHQKNRQGKCVQYTDMRSSPALNRYTALWPPQGDGAWNCESTSQSWRRVLLAGSWWKRICCWSCHSTSKHRCFVTQVMDKYTCKGLYAILLLLWWGNVIYYSTSLGNVQSGGEIISGAVLVKVQHVSRHVDK